MNDPVTRQELQEAIVNSELRIGAKIDRLRAEIRADMVVQGLALLAILLSVYFGVVASNQAAGTLGFDISTAVQEARRGFSEEVKSELDRREAKEADDSKSK